MQTVTVSPKFQVVIPQAVRQAMGLVSGVKLQVIQFEDRIELIPLRTAQSLRGTLPGLDTEVVRDDDRV
jgi:AbrB family looped-hinge helix DNA binding protein